MTTIQFGGLTFDDHASSGFTVGRLTGWWDGAPVKAKLNDRPQANGFFQVARGYRSGRVVTVEGSYVGSTMVDTYAAITALRALQSDGVPSDFRVTEPFSTLKAKALLTGAPELPNQLAFPFFTFKFDVTTFDPNLYGDDQVLTTGVPSSGGGLSWPLGPSSATGIYALPDTAVEAPSGSGVYTVTGGTETTTGSGIFSFTWSTPDVYWDFGPDGTSGRVSFTNTGTATTWPILTATGGLGAGFTATDVTTGQTVEFDRVIPVGSVVQINQRTGRAWIDAPTNDVSGYITARDFFQIGPGETHQIQFAGLGVVTGTPQFSLTAAPAYL